MRGQRSVLKLLRIITSCELWIVWYEICSLLLVVQIYRITLRLMTTRLVLKNYPLCLGDCLKLCRNTLLLDSALKTNLWVIWQISDGKCHMHKPRLSSFTISDIFLVEFKNSFIDNDFHQRRSNNTFLDFSF